MPQRLAKTVKRTTAKTSGSKRNATPSAIQNPPKLKKQVRKTLQEQCEIEVNEEIGKNLQKGKEQLIAILESGNGSIWTIQDEIKQKIFLLMVLSDLFESHPETVASHISGHQADVVRSLGSIAQLIVAILGVYAKNNDSNAAEALWDIAMKSANDVGVLADLNPSLLKNRARKSLYMPSRRAHSVKFTDNFEVRAHTIELGGAGAIKVTDKALYDLESKATEFAANLLNEKKEIRKLIRSVWGVQTNPNWRSSIGVDSISRLLGIPTEEAAAYLDIHPYCKATALDWWKKIISPILGRPETLELIKKHDKVFFDYLVKEADLPVDYEISQQLKNVCRQSVLKSLAPDNADDDD